MTDIKLLTEAEARGAWQATYSTHAMSITDYFAGLRKRGLMEAEPIDPLLEEAEAVHGEWSGGAYGKDADTIDLALAALRRGMELQREKLTREVVREAVDAATIDHFLRAKGSDHPDALDMRLKRLHAALLERLS